MFYQNLVAPQMVMFGGIRPLFFFPFLTFSLYSCAVTRLSQEVITVSLLFNCKIFLQFHRFPKFRKCAMEESIFPIFLFLGYK